MSNRIALILGSGAGVGAHVASRLRREGYRVATVSRSSKETENNGENNLALEGDLTDPTAVEGIFKRVRGAWGEPSVVVYNAYAVTSGKNPETALDIPTEEFQRHLAVNTTSAFVAAREALSGFKKLGRGNFFYTGNFLVWNPIPKLLTLGLGKTASAHFIQVADSVWREKGMRFYFVDEREQDGTPMWHGVNADVHADFISGVVEGSVKDVPWKATIVKGKGYVPFADDDDASS